MTCGRLNISALTRTTTQPAASSSAMRSISHDRYRASYQCCTPSYSTATFHSRHPMSTRTRRSGNLICVSGAGSPPSTKMSRSLLSCGDSAPPSTRSSALRSVATPRLPGCRQASSATSGAVIPVAFNNASRIGTGRGCKRPISNAVRAGVVARMLATRHTSSGSTVHERTTIPAGAWRSARRSSAGIDGSSHFVPWAAAAVRPHKVAPVDSHAARARSWAVIWTSRRRYTSRKTGRY